MDDGRGTLGEREVGSDRDHVVLTREHKLRTGQDRNERGSTLLWTPQSGPEVHVEGEALGLRGRFHCLAARLGERRRDAGRMDEFELTERREISRAQSRRGGTAAIVVDAPLVGFGRVLEVDPGRRVGIDDDQRIDSRLGDAVFDRYTERVVADSRQIGNTRTETVKGEGDVQFCSANPPGERLAARGKEHDEASPNVRTRGIEDGGSGRHERREMRGCRLSVLPPHAPAPSIAGLNPLHPLTLLLLVTDCSLRLPEDALECVLLIPDSLFAHRPSS